MTGVIVLSHGRLAEELVLAAQRIVGPIERLEAVSIDWDLDVLDARRRIEEAIARVGGAGGSVLVLTDMFGGTPTNLAMSLLDPNRIEVVTGVNLPMLIKFANLRDDGTLHEVAKRLAEQGRNSIQSASDLLEGGPGAAR